MDSCYLCDRPARGPVGPGVLAPAHTCKQCSEEHCSMEQYYELQWRMADEAGDHSWLLNHMIDHVTPPPTLGE